MMQGLFIYMGNRLETLAEKLAEIVARPLDFPLATEIIVVHSKGMERWISLALARHNGICANTRYPFPNTWLMSLFRLVEPDLPENAVYDVDFLAFKIMGLLPRLINEEGFEEIQRYLSDDTADIKRYQLSRKIAETFDQYLTFRPDLIFKWEKGEEHHWQAQLFRKISRGSESLHRAALKKRFLEKLDTQTLTADMLPQRVSVFSASYLPLFHLEVLTRISRLIEVNLLVMNPCCEYWSDILTDREIQKVRKNYGDTAVPDEDLFLDRGNPLLSSLGSMGREFISTILNLEGDVIELFDEPDHPPEDILSAVQSDILFLKDRAADPDTDSVTEIPAGHDNGHTIQIHNCHSPMREIEVLHDNLLSLFESDPSLFPGDIIVMTPDIETYAPFITAVFEGQTDETKKIPFSIADRSTGTHLPMVKGFMAILDLADTRFGVSHVMAILDGVGIKEKFCIKETELPLIEKWVRDTQIRWGRDGAHRGELGFSVSKENTWAAGIERMLLGYAMAGHHRRFYAGILPYDNIEGQDALILGRFLEFIHQLFDTAGDLTRKRTLAEWSVLLQDMLNRFFADDEQTALERQLLLTAFDNLATIEDVSGFDETIGLNVIQYILKWYLTADTRGSGFIAGGVTFCAMLPLRSIPAEIVCLIGMNSGNFPRNYHPPGFDLMAKHPRPGDRIRRHDDKYLFLQALVSARKRLYISYVGQSNRDNSRIPPSVVVSDLLDYITKGFHLSERDVVFTHRLQPFSEDYFHPSSRLFSYSVEDFDACKTAYERRFKDKAITDFISEPLSFPAPEFYTIDIGQLARFFANPSKFLLQQRLSIFLDDELPGFEDEEPFKLDGLNQYQMEQELLMARYDGEDDHHSYLVQRALGRLPHGNMGKISFSQMSQAVDQFVNKVLSHEEDKSPVKKEIDLKIEEFTLTGMVDDIYPEKIIRKVFAKFKPKYLIEAWICHLVLGILEETNRRSTLLLSKDDVWAFSPVMNGREHLFSLLKLYWKGLIEPLVFFPQSSFEYAQRVLGKGKSDSDALAPVKAIWEGSDFATGEGDDPYTKLCFSKSCFDDLYAAGDFQKNASIIFEPLLDHGQKMDMKSFVGKDIQK